MQPNLFEELFHVLDEKLRKRNAITSIQDANLKCESREEIVPFSLLLSPHYHGNLNREI